MPGRHAAPGRGRLVSETIRLIIFVAVIFVVLVGGALVVSNWLAGSDDTIPVAAPTSSSTTSTRPATTTTQATTTTIQPTTTTTAAPTTTTEVTTTTALPGPRPPSEVAVLVLNSTNSNGLAARVTAELAALGYQMLEEDNYQPPLSTTAVWYAPGFEMEAQVLAEHFPDAEIAPASGDGGPADIVVVLGASFSR